MYVCVSKNFQFYYVLALATAACLPLCIVSVLDLWPSLLTPGFKQGKKKHGGFMLPYPVQSPSVFCTLRSRHQHDVTKTTVEFYLKLSEYGKCFPRVQGTDSAGVCC